MADFIFADDYRLDESPTRNFYELFLKGLVHKHNNLMGVIQGFSSLILYDDDISSEVRDCAQQMQDSSKVASDLNQEVLTSGGCARCEQAAVSVGELGAFWTDKATEICNEAGVGLQANVRDKIPAVSGDGAKLTDIFTHLVKNAAEEAANVDGGSVAIDIFPPGEASPGSNVDLFIRNSSHPLDEAALRKAFEPFHTSKGAEHFGLGLTTSAILAGQMNMRLGLRYADKTTTAWLAMPPAA